MKRLNMVMAGTALMSIIWLCGAVGAAEQWQGIDDAVVERIAREHGREARKPLIDTSQGDLQLFVFLAAGSVGGFIAGYCWRSLLEGRRER